VCAHCNFEAAAAAPSVIDEEPPAAILASNVSKTAIAQDSLAISASDRSAIVQAAADIDVDRDGIGGRWRSHRHYKAESQTKVSEKKQAHNHSPYQRALRDIKFIIG
jgi:hypothetical protein